MSEPGKLVGVSLGPGDPGLMTRNAWEALSSPAHWTYPVTGISASSYALDIVRRGGLAIPADATPLVFPMSRDRVVLASAWVKAAHSVLALLHLGQDVLFLVEGDASTYATFEHLARTVRSLDPAIAVEVIAGVSSYCAAAARVGMPLAEQDDMFAVIPANYGIEIIDHLLDEFDTLVLLKVKPMLEQILDLLERRDIIGHARFVEKVGTPVERAIHDVTTLRGQEVAYLSLMLVHNPLRVSGGPRER